MLDFVDVYPIFLEHKAPPSVQRLIQAQGSGSFSSPKLGIVGPHPFHMAFHSMAYKWGY